VVIEKLTLAMLMLDYFGVSNTKQLNAKACWTSHAHAHTHTNQMSM